jgi:hypothetical protein
MDDSFTYIIRSNNRENAAVDNTNSCSIRLGGLPQMYKEFDCEVVAFYISEVDEVFGTTLIELRSSDLSITNGGDTQNKSLKTLGFLSLGNSNPFSSFNFRCENFNNKLVHFQLYEEVNVLLTSNFFASGIDDYNGSWTLVLKMTGVVNAR